MKFDRPTLLIGEIRESFSMAVNAITAHLLRSALTLLGVLIGVFSIIVVMTAMRVLERSVENNLSQLGSQTFAIQKYPAVQFGNSSDWEKYWRRKNITFEQGRDVEEKATPNNAGVQNLGDAVEQGQAVAERATLAAAVGVEGTFWGGQITTRYAKTAPNVQLLGDTPGSFPAHNWVIDEGRIFDDNDVDNARSVCVLGSALAKTAYPFGSALGQQLKINGINYAVVGVLAPKGGSVGGNQDNFAVIPLTTALHRYGLRWNGLSIMVQALNSSVYADCEEQVRGILRDVRKVRPGDPDDFELFSNDSLIDQFKTFTRAVRIGVTVVSSIALLAAGTGNRRPPRHRRQAAEHHGAIHPGSRRVVRSRRRHRRRARHTGRQHPCLVHESPARRPGGLDCAGAGAVLHRGNCLWNLSRVESREPRPD